MVDSLSAVLDQYYLATPIASSYGLMQLMWPSTITYGANWNDGDAGDPCLLMSPELNMRLASRILKYWFIGINWDGKYETYEAAVDSVLRHYNGSDSYPGAVRYWVSNYLVTK